MTKQADGANNRLSIKRETGTYVGVAAPPAIAEQRVPADSEPPFKDGEP